jgi:hypothetical protein
MSNMFVAEIGRFTVEWRKDTNAYHVVEDTGVFTKRQQPYESGFQYVDRGYAKGHKTKAGAIAYAKHLFETEGE